MTDLHVTSTLVAPRRSEQFDDVETAQAIELDGAELAGTFAA